MEHRVNGTGGDKVDWRVEVADVDSLAGVAIRLRSPIQFEGCAFTVFYNFHLIYVAISSGMRLGKLLVTAGI